MEKITIETTIASDIATVWDAWNSPEAVTKWNAASEDWYCPFGQNDLREGGTFSYRMEAKDGSEGFDFGGTYTKVVPHAQIAYVMSDGREVVTTFEVREDSTIHITESFDPETENPLDMQRAGWQAILDSFKRYVEGLK